MSATETIAGPAGAIECAIDEPAQAAAGVAVIAHPHSLMGGTMDNKVVHTLARACVRQGLRAVRFNFRGVGASAGTWDDGRGEAEDLLAVIRHYRAAGQPFVLGGFSFGGFVATCAAQALGADAPQRLLLVAPAASNFAIQPVRAERTLLIHGEADDVVPLTAVLDWARPQSLPVTVVPGVGHFFHGQLPLLRELVAHDLRAALMPSAHGG